MSSSTSSTSKKKKIVTPICQQSPALLDQSVEKSSSVFDTLSQFPSSPPIPRFRINQLPRLSQRELPIYSSPSRFVTRRIEPRPNSPIASSEGAEVILLAACQSVEVAEKEDFEGAPVDPYSEEDDNDAFLNQCSSEESSSEEEHSSNEEEWDDDNDLHPPQPPQCPRMTTCYGEPSLFQLYPRW